jgi:predicted DNA-binding protein
MKRANKKLMAFRLRKEVQVALTAIAKRSGKTKTRIMEDAILIHAKDIAA